MRIKVESRQGGGLTFAQINTTSINCSTSRTILCGGPGDPVIFFASTGVLDGGSGRSTSSVISRWSYGHRRKAAYEKQAWSAGNASITSTSWARPITVGQIGVERHRCLLWFVSRARADRPGRNTLRPAG